MADRTKRLTEGGLMIALASILSLINLFKLPQGGSITAGSMVPIIFFALRWGLKKGIFLGVVYGLVQYLITPTGIFHPVQFLLDYPIAFGFLGVAGIGSKYFNSLDNHLPMVLFSSSLAILGRLVCHILSGVVFFSAYAGSQNPWVYSLIYNGSFILGELIISLIIVSILYRPLRRNIN